MEIQNTNRAAELEQYLRSRINSIPYRDLIKEIRVDEGDSESSLKITLVPVDDVVAFGRISVRLAGADTDSKWRRKQKAELPMHRIALSPWLKPAI